LKLLEILFQDDHLVAVNKPHGLLVHRSPIAADAEEFAVQILRDQIGRKVYPVHRLDRKTGGVLLFALNETTNSLMQQAFMNKEVAKKYLSLVRGFTDDEGTIDHPLTNEAGKVQDAVTHFRTVNRYSIPISSGTFPTSRYSLLEVDPETGRMHQIRKHFAHIFHPIIGDRPHGCNKQNKFFLENFNMNTMLLHAESLGFSHPVEHSMITINAPLQKEFTRMVSLLNDLSLKDPDPDHNSQNQQ
jgi:tRNA pseudouridine65 synthase